MDQIIVVGSGGFAREVKDLIDQIWHLKFNRFVNHEDDIAELNNFENKKFVVAIGDPFVREIIYKRLMEKNFVISDALIHPTVVIGSGNQIGLGSVICAGTIITTNVYIGMGSIINLRTNIGHDVTIGNFVTVSPGVNISGNVMIGDCSYIGTGSSIREKIKVGKNCVLGGGAFLAENQCDHTMHVGVPAKFKTYIGINAGPK